MSKERFKIYDTTIKRNKKNTNHNTFYQTKHTTQKKLRTCIKRRNRCRRTNTHKSKKKGFYRKLSLKRFNKKKYTIKEAMYKAYSV